MVTIDATCADGRTLQEFAKLLEARQKYLNETTEDACAAIAIDALKSIRAMTKKATKSSVVKDVSVKRLGSMYPSYTKQGGTKQFCLRYSGSNRRYEGTAKIIQTDWGSDLKQNQVYQFFYNTDKGKLEYLIVSPSQSEAIQWAKNFKKKRAMQFAGLARRALTILMMKTTTLRDGGDNVSAQVSNKANQQTRKVESKSGGLLNATYSLLLEDNLDYASGAVQGGEMGVNLALQKAMNKVTSVINKRCEKLLLFEPLPAPFPSIR